MVEFSLGHEDYVPVIPDPLTLVWLEMLNPRLVIRIIVMIVIWKE